MSETRPGGEIPDEVKNQVVNGKPRVITEHLPEKSLNEYKDWTSKRQKQLQQMLEVGMQIAKLQKDQQEVYDKIQISNNGISRILQEASRKLRIEKRTEYQWQFKGDSFLGILKEQPQKSKEA
jgi:hypothetical protein